MQFKLDIKQALAASRLAPEAMINSINRTLLETAIYAQRCFRKNMPVGKTGALRRTVYYTFLGKTRVRIEPEQKYADYVEFGTRPHFPPVEAITPWANMHGINPYALAHSIAKHGTRPHPFLDRTVSEVRPFAERSLARNVQQTINKVL